MASGAAAPAPRTEQRGVDSGFLPAGRSDRTGSVCGLVLLFLPVYTNRQSPATLVLPLPRADGRIDNPKFYWCAAPNRANL